MADHPIQPWKVLASSIAFNERWLRVRKDTVELPSGKIVNDYFMWEAPHIVMVVPITTAGMFVMVEQYRHAIGKVLLQFPAGAADGREPTETAARRELREETGYSAHELIYLGSSAPYSTKITDTMDIYLAPNATDTHMPHHDEQEETNVHLLTAEEVLALIEPGQSQPADLFAAAFLALRYLKKL